jgi:predicted flap endonuclease-1-like 5' DNA nuclease
MRAFKVFIFGLLYGWVFKVAFDRIYRENDMEDVRSENRSLKEYIHSLESQLQSRSLEAKSMPRSAPQALPVEAPAEQQMDLQAEPKAMAAPKPPPSGKDDLKAIKGIGPAIEKKLNNAGIQTFAALAALSKRDLETILGSQVNRLQDENDLIAQAKKLARKK